MELMAKPNGHQDGHQQDNNPQQQQPQQGNEAHEEQAPVVSEVLSGIGPQSSDDSVGLPDLNMAVDDHNILPAHNEGNDFDLNMEVPDPVDMEVVQALPPNPVQDHQVMEAVLALPAIPVQTQQEDELMAENDQEQQ